MSSDQNTNIAYIRFGELPEGGRSGIYDGDNGKIGEERGVSCYEAVLIEGRYRILVPSPCYYSTFTTMLACYDQLTPYLIEGEPVLRNARIVKEIDPDFSCYNKNNPKFLD